MATPATLTQALAFSHAPVKLLLVVPSPINDANRLNLSAELAEINAALENIRAPVDIVRLNPPTLGSLRLALATQAFDIVHIAAHAGPAGVELEDDDGTAIHIKEDQFAGLFAAYRKSLLILNGCSTEALADRIGRDAPEVTTLSVAGDLDRRDAVRVIGEIYRHTFTETPERVALSARDVLRHHEHRRGSPVRARGNYCDQMPDSIHLGTARPNYYACAQPSNIPVSHKVMVDRVVELLQIHDLLFDDSVNGPYLGIVGIPGSGKTTLVQTAANRYGWRFPHGTGYISLRGGDFVASDVGLAFGWRKSAAVASVIQAARRMSRGRYLLVLDDMEEAGTEAIAETRALLSAWDTTLGGRAVLVFHTRRADFQDLIGANWVTVRGLSVEAGSDLIVARLGGAEHARQAVGGDVSEASQLCHGHPKTIESAASLLQLGQRWADLKTELQQLSGEGALTVNDEMLGRVIARLEQRAPAVRDLLDAWTVLEDGCQESIWRRLAVADPRSNPAKGQLDVALGELHGASLIDRYEVSGVGRCVMHPLLVAHLRRRHDALSEQRTRQIVKTQLAEQSRLASADDYPTGEVGNIKRALHLAKRLGLDRDIVRYGIAAAGDQQLPLVRRGPWQLARDVLDVAVSGAEAISDNDRAAQFLLVCGTVEYRLANFEAARQAYEKAASLATGTGHTSLRLLALRGMGQVLYRVGELDEAERLYQSARQLAGEDPVAVDIDHQLGKVAYRRRRLAEARRLLEQVRDARRQAGNIRDLAKTTHELARVEHATGDRAAARQLYEEALELERQVRDPVTEQATLFQLGRLALDDKRITDAARLFAESRHLSEELSDELWIVHGHFGQALLTLAQGDQAAALGKAQEALEESQRMNIGLTAEIREWIDSLISGQAN